MVENRIFRKKLVVVGDSKCGKSALLFKLAKEQFLEAYLPTLFEHYAAEVSSSQGLVQVSMYDTPGDDNYSHIRPLSYPDSDVLLLCFDLSRPPSYRRLFSKWIPEVKEYCPNIPFLIVGCKSDIKLEPRKPGEYNVPELTPSTPDEVSQLLHHTGAIGYFTSSSKTDENLLEILSDSVEVTLRRKRHSFRSFKRRSVSIVSNPESEPRISYSSGLRRRAFTDISTNQNNFTQNEDARCFPAFHFRKRVTSESVYFPNQQTYCSIL